MSDTENIKVEVNFAELANQIRELAKLLKCTQATATTVLGYVMRITNKLMSADEIHTWIKHLVATKSPQQLSMDERLLCVTLGMLKRKTPFVAAASKVGRNEQCPCNSGAKYKNCCLELAKAHDHERFYGGKV